MILAFALLASASLAQADAHSFFDPESDPWEVRVFAGFDHVLSTDVNFMGASDEVDFGGGFATGASVGYRFNQSFSFELDYTYRSAGEAKVPASLGLGAGAELDVASVTITPSIWYRGSADR
ncbi:MAG: hypothetical protein AAF514_01020 [Verrucomicrobiota bacterium]